MLDQTLTPDPSHHLDLELMLGRKVQLSQKIQGIVNQVLKRKTKNSNVHLQSKYCMTHQSALELALPPSLRIHIMPEGFVKYL